MTRVLALLLVSTCGCRQPVPAVQPTDDRSRAVYAAGQVEGASRTIAMAFERPGRVLEIPVAAGQAVAAGTVLARLDAVVAEAAVTREACLVALAGAECAEAERVREFARRMAGTRAAPQEEARQAEAALRVAQARVAVAQAQLKLAEVERQQETLTAPGDAVILAVLCEPGHLATGPVLTLVAAGPRRVRAYVEELDALALAVGDRCRVEVDRWPTLTGRITWIAPQLTPKRLTTHEPGERTDVLTREVLIGLDEPPALPVGLRVDVYIERGAS